MTTPAEAVRQALRERLGERARLIVSTDAVLQRLLRDAQAHVVALLAGQPSDFQQWRLPQTLAQIEAMLDGAVSSGAVAVDAALRASWQQGEDFVDKPLAAGGLAVEAQLPVLDSTLLGGLRSFTTGRIKDIGRATLRSVDNSLSLVTLGAQTPYEAIKQIQAALGDEGTRRATTIVRTEVGRAFAVASQARMEQAETRVPDLQKLWRRSGKIHSRWNHDAIDGQVQPVKSPFVLPSLDGPVKMMHPHDPKAPVGEVINCGCIALPHRASWKVVTPGAKPFTELETRLDGRKAQLDQAAKRAGLRRS